MSDVGRYTRSYSVFQHMLNRIEIGEYRQELLA
jgi:hypothetical protein